MLGKLRHRITFQTKSAGDDWGTSATWTPSNTVYADIQPLSGEELTDAQQLDSKVTHSVRVRYLSSVVETMRFTHGSDVFHIASVINEGQRDTWLLLKASLLR